MAVERKGRLWNARGGCGTQGAAVERKGRHTMTVVIINNKRLLFE